MVCAASRLMLENFPRLLALPLYRDGGGSTWVPHWASITLLYCACPAASLQETSECAPHLEPGTQVGSVVDVWGQVVIYVDGKWKSEHRKIKDLEFRQQAHDPELGCSV